MPDEFEFRYWFKKGFEDMEEMESLDYLFENTDELMEHRLSIMFNSYY